MLLCLRRLLPLFLAASLAACTLIGSKLVYEKPAMFGVLAVTDEFDGMRTMRFGSNSATQTSIKVGDPDHLEFDYLKLALAGLVLAEAPRRVLIVGLGGGALPVFLRRNFPQLQIDVVEIDPEVVIAAKLYFAFHEDALMKAHLGDGRAFIERAVAGSYDVVMLDAFGSGEVPEHLTTLEFLVAVKKATAPGGVVVSNVWKRLYNRQYDAMLRTYQEVFADVDVIATSRDVNMMIVAFPLAPKLTREQFVAGARELSLRQNFRFNLGLLVDRGLDTRPVERTDVAVLRDAASSNFSAGGVANPETR